MLEILIETDMGIDVAEELIANLKREVGARGAADTSEACDLLVELIGRNLSSPLHTLAPNDLSDAGIADPVVLLLTGVNGSGNLIHALAPVANANKEIHPNLATTESWARTATIVFMRSPCHGILWTTIPGTHYLILLSPLQKPLSRCERRSGVPPVLI